MATVSERVRQLRVAMANAFESEREEIIEQALLAERRLAMVLAIEIADTVCGDEWAERRQEESYGARKVSKALRAAAEKEVAK